MLRRHEVIERLSKIAREGDFPRGTLVSAGPMLVEIELRDSDRYSSIVDELRIGGPFIDIQAAAQALSRPMAELNDELALIEYDAAGGLAVLRSAVPLQEPEAVEYWEAQIYPGLMRMARYRKEHAAADREQQGVPMLHRSLATLAEELAATLADVR